MVFMLLYTIIMLQASPQSILMWDEIYISMESLRSKRYKNAPYDANSDELLPSEDLAALQKHNKAIFDRMNLLLAEFHTLKHNANGPFHKRASISLMPVTMQAIKQYMLSKLLDEQNILSDVLVGTYSRRGHMSM